MQISGEVQIVGTAGDLVGTNEGAGDTEGADVTVEGVSDGGVGSKSDGAGDEEGEDVSTVILLGSGLILGDGLTLGPVVLSRGLALGVLWSSVGAGDDEGEPVPLLGCPSEGAGLVLGVL
jgi:hypothetical protein